MADTVLNQLAAPLAPQRREPAKSIVATAMSPSTDGHVDISVGGSTSRVTTTTKVEQGESVLVTLVGRTPVVTGRVGWGDLASVKIDYATERANIGAAYIGELTAQNITAQNIGAAVVKAGKLDADTINAATAYIDVLKASNVEASDLVADHAKVGTLDADEINAAVATVGTLDAEQLNAAAAYVGELTAGNVTADELVAAQAKVESLDADQINAATAYVGELSAANVTAAQLSAANAYVGTLTSASITADSLTAANAYVAALTAGNLTAAGLVADHAEIGSLNTKYANIDFANVSVAQFGEFFAKSGILQNIVTEGGTVTGTLVGVTIKGDLIEGGTVKADKLVILGEDGLYYRLNTDGETVAEQQTDANSLNGSHIQAQTVTADKISVTDLVAFGATIGGVVIEDGSVHSFAKDSSLSDVAGFFLGDDGSVGIGTDESYIRFDAGSGTLDINASSVSIAGDGIATMGSIAEIQVQADEVSARVEALTGEVSGVVQRADSIEMTLTQAVDGLTEDVGAISERVEPVVAMMRLEQDSQGRPVLTMGDSASSMGMSLSSTELGFKDGGVVVAYINNQEMRITRASVTDMLRFGEFGFVPRQNGNMALKWMGGV